MSNHPWSAKNRRKGAGALNAVEDALTDPVGTVLGSAGKTVRKAAKEITNALGIGTGADDEKYARRLGWVRHLYEAAAIHWGPAFQALRAIGGIEPLPLTYTRARDPELFKTNDPQYPYIEVSTLPRGWNAPGSWGKAYKKIIDRAAAKAEEFDAQQKAEGWVWLAGNGIAGDSGAGSDAGTSFGPTTTTPTPSAPTASPSGTWGGTATAGSPSTPRPCPPGKERNPATGRCRKIPPSSGGSSSGGSWLGPGTGTAAPVAGGKPPKPCGPGKERNPVTGRCVNVCKYGPRDADGKCPRKQSSAPNKNERAQIAKASKAAEKIVEAGVLGAGKALRAGLKAAGVPLGTAVGTALAVAAAAIGGWFIGRAFDDWVQDNDLAAVKAKASIRLRQAREALAKELGVYDVNKPGVGLTLAQQSAITKAWKDSIAAIEQTAYHAAPGGSSTERPGA